jgi:hypothetical protein
MELAGRVWVSFVKNRIENEGNLEAKSTKVTFDGCLRGMAIHSCQDGPASAGTLPAAGGPSTLKIAPTQRTPLPACSWQGGENRTEFQTNNNWSTRPSFDRSEWQARTEPLELLLMTAPIPPVLSLHTCIYLREGKQCEMTGRTRLHTQNCKDFGRDCPAGSGPNKKKQE